MIFTCWYNEMLLILVRSDKFDAKECKCDVMNLYEIPYFLPYKMHLWQGIPHIFRELHSLLSKDFCPRLYTIECPSSEIHKQNLQITLKMMVHPHSQPTWLGFFKLLTDYSIVWRATRLSSVTCNNLSRICTGTWITYYIVLWYYYTDLGVLKVRVDLCVSVISPNAPKSSAAVSAIMPATFTKFWCVLSQICWLLW